MLKWNGEGTKATNSEPPLPKGDMEMTIDTTATANLNAAELETRCFKIARMRKYIEELTESVKAEEAKVKDALNASGESEVEAGNFICKIVHVAESRIVDTAKIKKAGLFDEYSKTKAGYDALRITERV